MAQTIQRRGSVAPERPDRIRVRFVDDDRSWRDLMARKLALTDPPVDVITRSDTQAALACLAPESIDAIVCGYKMPGMNGLDMLDRVREDHGNLPFLLFTGRGDETVGSEAIFAGVDDYVPKQTVEDAVSLLANRIENLVQADRMRRRIERREQGFSKLLVDSPVVTRLLDRDGTNLYVSPAARAVLGYDPDRLIDATKFEYVHPEDLAESGTCSTGSSHRTTR